MKIQDWCIRTKRDTILWMKKTQVKTKYNFEEMKARATSDDPLVRKEIFIEYFERFAEFPSFVFDNNNGMDSRLFETIRDLTNDSETPKAMQEGITVLLNRLPSHESEM